MARWLLMAWNHARGVGKMWKTTRTCLIKLIHKKAEKDKITNYRPISLCNVDYKIIAKVLAMRIKKVMNSIIDEEQTGFVPERDIRINVMAQAYWEKINKYKKEGGELLLDFEKAFDRVDRVFIEMCLM